MFNGKTLKVKQLGNSIWVEEQYATVWTEQNQILLFFAGVLVVLAYLVKILARKNDKQA
jgi:hypothetical protein